MAQEYVNKYIITAKRNTELYYGDGFNETAPYSAKAQALIMNVDNTFSPYNIEADLLYFEKFGIESVRVAFTLEDWTMEEYISA